MKLSSNIQFQSSRHEIRAYSQYKSRLEYLAMCADLEVDYVSLKPIEKSKIHVIDPVTESTKGTILIMYFTEND